MPQIPPEVVIARERLGKALKTIITIPGLGAENLDFNEFMKGADEIFFDQNKWPAIVKFQQKAEAQVRSFNLPRQPSDADLLKAVDILGVFIRDVAHDIMDLGWGAAGGLEGWICGNLKYNAQKRAMIPMLYTRLRMELLGYK
jgi:hypothetical protein